MALARRVYLYTMALAAAIALTVGLLQLANVAAGALLGLPLDRIDLARSLAIVLVAAPLAWAHLSIANRLARGDETERSAALRKLFLYALLATGLLVTAIAAEFVQEQAWRLIFGLVSPPLDIWGADVLGWGIGLLWGLGVLVVGWRFLRGDGDLLAESRWGATWRRLWLAAAGLLALGFFLAQSGELIQALFTPLLPRSTRPIDGSNWWLSTVAIALAISTVALLVWRWTWQTHRRWTASGRAESESWLMQLYLYGGLAAGVGVALAAVALLLRQGILWMMGAALPATLPAWQEVIEPAGFLLPALWVWWMYRRRISDWETAWETAEQNRWFHLALGRVYTYLLAAAGLGLIWYGGNNLVQSLVRPLLIPAADLKLGEDILSDAIATALAMLLVGAPVWWWHWRRIQEIAAGTDALAASERRSYLRKGYLFGVLLIAALIVLFQLIPTFYRAILWLLGEQDLSLRNDFVNALAPTLISLVVWLWHFWVLRADNRRDDAELEPPVEPAPKVGKTALLAERAQLVERLAEIEAALINLAADKHP